LSQDVAVRRGDHWPKTACYFAVFVALGLETASLGPTLPGLAGHTGTQLDEISLVFTAHSLGYLAGSFLAGRLYDRMPGHRLMGAMVILMAAMLVLVPLLPALWLLAASWLVLGVAGGGLDVGGNTLLVWVHGRQVGPFMSGLHFFFGVGAFLAPVIVGLALGLSGDIQGAYWTLALLVLPVTFWLFRVPSPPSPAAAIDRPATDGLEAGDQRSETLAQSKGHGQSILPTKRPRPRAAVSGRRVVVLITLLLALYVGAEVAFAGWIYTYAMALGVSDETMAAYLTSAFWGALTLGRLLGVPLAARYRPRSLLLADLAGCLISVGFLLLVPATAAATWLGTLGLGLAMATIFPTSLSLAERRIPITGRVTGWFLVGSSLGAMLLPWLIGQLFESLGPQITLVAIGFDLALALGVLVVLLATDQPPAVPASP